MHLSLDKGVAHVHVTEGVFKLGVHISYMFSWVLQLQQLPESLLLLLPYLFSHVLEINTWTVNIRRAAKLRVLCHVGCQEGACWLHKWLIKDALRQFSGVVCRGRS